MSGLPLEQIVAQCFLFVVVAATLAPCARWAWRRVGQPQYASARVAVPSRARLRR